MPEQQHQPSSMKVYELARELGIDSLSLLDKLASLNIKVKNHMSDLGEDDVRLARDSLLKKSDDKAPKKTTRSGTTVRKKKTDAATGTTPAATKAASKAAPTAATAAGAATPVLKRRGGTTTAAAAATPPPAATAAGTTAATTPESPAASNAIIRRRTKSSDGGGETTTSTLISQGQAISTSTKVTTQDGEEEILPQETQAEETETQMEATDASYSEETTLEASETENEPVEAGEEDTSPETTPKPEGRKPVVLPPRPVAPRKSFLKIVEASAPIKPKIVAVAPTVKPSPIRGVTTKEDKDGFRVIKMTKENLDQMAEDEKNKKKVGGGIREGEIKPEDVRFADYRKKELVFLPKRKRLPMGKELKRTEITQAAQHKRVVEMGDTISVGDLASQLSAKAGEVIRKLMGMGTMATINQAVDFDTATLIATEYGYEVKNVAFKEEEVLDTTQDAAEDLKSRPPVVTIMGHVDHGKTSLLDAIRSADVAAGEAGGITQHIGAYAVEKNGKIISFIDTPGHEAFTAMRARGANVTDIVILVVAADDGVMPQTREALSHAKAAGVPIIVAMNKMDKPGANPEKIKQQLAELDLLAEDWGGQSQFVPVSAAKKTGLDELLEAILLNAEVLDLKANPKPMADGTVLEGRLEKGRGPVATVVVKRGTLRVGDYITSGTVYGRIRSLMNDKGAQVKEVTPGLAVEVLGFESLPSAGEPFNCVNDDRAASELVSNRRNKILAEKSVQQKVSLDDLFAKIKSGTTKELGLVLKADVQGSVEAVRDSLVKLSNEQVKVKVLLAATGGITESDVLLASASNAVIIGFNVRPETKARQVAEAEHIEIKCYNIIYELIDEVKGSMTGLLDKKKIEKYLGRAEVRQVFSVPKAGNIAGCSVVDGKIVRGARVRLLRESRIIFEGEMSSLRRFKDDVKEVAEGYECGIGIEKYNDLKIGDLIEAYTIEMIAGVLNS